MLCDLRTLVSSVYIVFKAHSPGVSVNQLTLNFFVIGQCALEDSQEQCKSCLSDKDPQGH